MSKRKDRNYIEHIPQRVSAYNWTADESGIVTIEVENTGVFNRIAQKLFNKPKISYVHLDKMGSFIWKSIDGKKTIYEIGELVDKAFGGEAKPLYERLSKYIQILESYKFVSID